MAFLDELPSSLVSQILGPFHPFLILKLFSIDCFCCTYQIYSKVCSNFRFFLMIVFESIKSNSEIHVRVFDAWFQLVVKSSKNFNVSKWNSNDFQTPFKQSIGDPSRSKTPAQF